MIKQNNQKPLLSIVLVNHNARKLTQHCIQSIYDKTKNTLIEIILVDNASLDGSAVCLKEKFPEIIIIQNINNTGFAHANNQAIKISSGKYVMLLNNDTVLKNEALDKMIAFMDEDEEAAALTCKLFNRDGVTIQRNCRTFPTPSGTMFGRASLLTKLFPNNPWSSKNLLTDWDYNSAREIDWASGAALMVRRSVIDQVGLLDDKNFFIYWEDTDWCKRIHGAGWKIFFTPEAEIIHFTGSGGGRRSFLLSNLMIYQMHRSAYNYFRKHYFKSWLNPMTISTFLGFVLLVSIKILLNSTKILLRYFKHLFALSR
ncbi:glycosyltransferase family 2 protein [Candidatus Margulisiibacteriota bacterium]